MTKAQKIIVLAAVLLLLFSLVANHMQTGPRFWPDIDWERFGIQAILIFLGAGVAFRIARKRKTDGK